MADRATNAANGEKIEQGDDAKQEDARASLKIDKDVAQKFSQLSKQRWPNQTAFLAHLLDLYAREDDATDLRDDDGTLLVSYRAIVHAPLRFDGSVRRVGPPTVAAPASDSSGEGSG